MPDFLKCYSLILLLINIQGVALASAYQVEHPSEYVYESNSVTRSEEGEANCRRYPPTSGDAAIHYTHCDGTQLRLTDSDLGSEQYSSSDCYVWNGRLGSSQLLFIFSKSVNLTTITLHYYNDNGLGLPSLRFFVVPDDFEIWNALVASYGHVDIAAVPPDGESAGRRKVSANFDFMNVTKVLLLKFSSSFTFAVSEVDFFTCNAIKLGTSTQISFTTIHTTATVSSFREPTTNLAKQPITETTNEPNATDLSNNIITSTENLVTGDTSTDTGVAIYIGTGIVIAIAMILLLTVIAAIALVLMRKSAQKRKVDYLDSSYSTLCRESGQQMQTQSLHTSNDLYDQIQLSPSTGQAEFISRNETANTNNSPPHQTEYDIHPSVDKDKPKSAKLKITASTISTQYEDKSTSEQPTYAVVNKKKTQKTEKESVHCENQNIAEVSLNEGESEQNAVDHGNHLQESLDSPGVTTQFFSRTIDLPEELYTAVKKKPKDRPIEDEIAPPIPPYTTEELYTAVKKKPHASTTGDDEEAPQIPPHTFEQLYTAVQKKPKANATVDEEEAPPIPAHTVEELYTAVVKKPKVSTAEDEEEAPPVPPYTVDEL